MMIWATQRTVLLAGLLMSITPAAPDPAAGSAASATPTPVRDLNLPMSILLNGTLPRYVVGEVVVGGRLQHVTFDAGNPRATILTSEGCLGCSSGCPSAVPSCAQTGSNFCAPSRPQEYVPLGAYTVNASEACAPGTQHAGTLDNTPVCQQCFDGGNHARFYRLARSDVSVVSSTGPVTFPHMPFGALVRVTPLQDRIWGNIGLGHGSDFMKETGSTALGLHLRPAPLLSNITLNPLRSHFSSWHSASFTVSSNRDFAMSVLLGYEQCGHAVFRIDTGNQGISIADDGIATQLALHAQGEWASNGMLMVPAASWWQPPVLSFNIGSIQVQIPGSKWVLPAGKSVFVRYHKNVLGLPFITAGDWVFDDVALELYFRAA